MKRAKKSEFVTKRMRLNGKTVRITEPRESITWEQFVKDMKPVLIKMARHKH